MSKLFTILLILSSTLMLIFSPENILSTYLSGAEKAVTFSISMIAIYAFWLSIIEIMERCGFLKFISALLYPVFSKLFHTKDKESLNQISLNFTSNFLGMSNAATPSGIAATTLLAKKEEKINHDISVLMVLNTTCLQLIPTTVIGLRTLYDSAQPSSIIIPTFLTSLTVTIIGLFLVKLLSIRRKR